MVPPGMPRVDLQPSTLRHLKAFAGGRALDDAIEALLDARAKQVLGKWVAEADASGWTRDG